jgi:integrase
VNIVKPIRDLKKIEAMKRMLHNKRDILLFTMGINTALRISDLLSLTINVRDNKGKLLQAVRLKNRKQEK